MENFKNMIAEMINVCLKYYEPHESELSGKQLKDLNELLLVRNILSPENCSGQPDGSENSHPICEKQLVYD